MLSRIKHPNPRLGTFTDRLGGVVFHDGFAEVDLTDEPHLRAAYIQHGYGISVFTGVTVDMETLTTGGGAQVDLPGELDGTPGVLPTAVEGNGEQTAPALDYLDDWTKAKLIAYAGEQGFDLGDAKTKPQILAVIGAHAPDASVEVEEA